MDGILLTQFVRRLANSLTEKLHSSSGVMVRNRQFNQSNPSSQIGVVLMLYLLLLQCVLWLAGCCDLIKYRVDLVVGTWIQFIFTFSFFKIRCYHWIDLLDEISWAVSVPSCYYTGIKWCFPGEYVMHSTRVTVVVMNHHELGHHQLCISFDDALLWYIAWPLLVGSTHSIWKSSKQKDSF